MSLKLSYTIGVLILAWLSRHVARLLYNIFLHPLKNYPGPLGAQATEWYKTYIELFQQKSWTDQLIELHKRYGEHPSSCPFDTDENWLRTLREGDSCRTE